MNKYIYFILIFSTSLSANCEKGINPDEVENFAKNFTIKKCIKSKKEKSCECNSKNIDKFPDIIEEKESFRKNTLEVNKAIAKKAMKQGLIDTVISSIKGLF